MAILRGKRHAEWVCASAILLCTTFAVLAKTAPPQPDRDLDATLDVMPDMGDRFESIDELMQDEKWDRALEKLAEIADEAGDTVWSADGRTYVSVHDFVRRRIISMPPRGLAWYSLRYDPEARALLEEGLSKQDVAALDEVADKYPASSFAVPALDAAASILIDRGDFGSAMARLEGRLSRPVPHGASEAVARSRAMALAKLAFCKARLGDERGAEAALARLRELGDIGNVKLGDGREDVNAFVGSALKTGPGASGDPPGRAWPAPGGQLSHAPPMIDVRPDLSRRWSLEIAVKMKTPPGGPDRYASRAAIVARSPYGGYAPGSEISPLPVTDEAGVVYVNSGRGVFAVDPITGRQRWVAWPKTPPLPSDARRRMAQAAYYQRLLWGMWSRYLGAKSVSVGGGRVFAVELLGQQRQPYVALSAFDAATGKRLWYFPQRADPDEFAGQAWFPWAPKVVGEKLIGLAWLNDQVFVCALDAKTGKVDWKVFIAADPMRAIRGYGRQGVQLRFGQPVVLSGGVAYAATCTGVVAAVRVRDGQLLWISRYPRTAIRVKRPDPRRVGYVTYEEEGGWEAGFPVVTRGRLYVAPADSDSLLVFNCRTGVVVREIPRGNHTHFAGVHNGSLILVGPETVAQDPNTGLARWLVPTPFQLEGLPVLTESAVLIPTKGALCEIALNGRVVRRMNPITGANPGLPLGNIVSCDGRLIAANPRYVTGYFSFSETYEHLTGQIEQYPCVAGHRLDRADLFFLHKKYADALDDLEAAEAILAEQPDADAELNGRLKRIMFETRLNLSAAGKANGVAHADAAEKYVSYDADRGRLRLARGAALVAAGRYQDAVDEYLVITRELAGVKLEADLSNYRGVGLPPGRWAGDARSVDTLPLAGVVAQWRIGELAEQHGEGVYARVDAELRREFELFVSARNAGALRRMQLTHPHSSLADNCLLEMARIVAKDELGALRAQILLRSLIFRYERSEVLGEAYAMLLAQCIRSSRFRLAAAVLKEIQTKHPSVTILWEGEELKGAELAARLMQLKEIKEAAALTRALPSIAGPLRLAWNSGSESEALVTVVSDDNCFDRGVGLAANIQPGPKRFAYFGSITKLRAFDTATGQTLWTANVEADWCIGDADVGYSQWSRNRYRAVVVCSGSVVALCHNRGIIAFDLGTGAQLWREQWTRPPTTHPAMWVDSRVVRVHRRVWQAINQRPVFAADAGRIFCHIPDGTFTCFDAGTGRVLWRDQGKGYATGPIGLLGDKVAVGRVDPHTITVYSALDGKVIYTKPMPGPYPNPPAYDRVQKRILLRDGNHLVCHAAADFKRLWKSSDAARSGYAAPWGVEVLQNNRVAVTRYVRVGNRQGWGVVMINGKDGRRMWTYAVPPYRSEEGVRTQSNMTHGPACGKRFLFVPLQNRIDIRKGKVSTLKQTVSVHVVDLASGKKVRELSVEIKGPGQRKYVYAIVTGWAAEHAILISRAYDGRRREARLDVLGADGKSALSEKLPSFLLTGPYAGMLQQRAEPVVTVDGALLVPTGKGITCYAPGGEKPPEERTEEKTNEKK